MNFRPENIPGPDPLQGPLKILGLQALHGAGYYSAGPVIIMQLNLGEFDEVFTHTIDGFFEKLKDTLPGLEEHHCSEGETGGFFSRVTGGTLLGHVAEHIAIELQNLAGMDVSFGKTRSTGQKGIYNVVFRFQGQDAGLYAAKASVDILNRILTGNEINTDLYVDNLTRIREQSELIPGTLAIVNEAHERNIPVIRLESYNLIQLGTGKFQKRIRNTVSSDTPLLAAENSTDVFLNTLMLANAGIPVAKTLKTRIAEEAFDFWKRLNKPVTLKTTKKNEHNCVFPALNNLENINAAFVLCKNHSDEIMVQEQIPGMLYRLLVIDDRFVAASLLQQPEIIGNGKDNIARLIEKLNEDQNRKPGKKGSLDVLQPIDEMLETLSFYGFTLDDVPEEGVKILLNNIPTIENGALTSDVTGIVHPHNRNIAERVAEITGLRVAGINLVCADISKPIEDTNGAVTGVDMAPDMRMHINPWKGSKRDVASPFVNMLFPENTPSRIPVVSVAGSAGKSVCAYLISFMLEKEGHKTGLAHSDGIYIGGRRIIREDMANYHAAQLILKDPGVEYAVLETSVESIINHGLGYDFADVGIILNVHAQHLNNNYIRSTEDLAYAKSVVAEEVYSEGFSILNADDPLVLKMSERIYSKPVLFTLDTENPDFRKHCLRGGTGAGKENNELFLWTSGGKHRIAALEEIPLWVNGKNDILLESILAAICAMAAFNMRPDRISHLLKAFKPASASLHGRLMTLFPGENTVIIDKPAGPKALQNLRNKMQEQQSNSEIFIDLSGNLPDDFWFHFSDVFKNEKVQVNLFFSQNELIKVDKTEIKENNNLIIPLKERYRKVNLLHQGMNKMEITDHIKTQADNESVRNFEFIYWEKPADCIKQLERHNKPATFFIFSWNFRYLQHLISQNLIIL
jgi:cyanophycin synthetase